MDSVVAACDDAFVQRFCLRNEVLFLAGHAVVVGPTMHFGEFVAPVTVYGGGLRRLPFQCRATPGVVIRFLPFEQAPDHVEDEDRLRGRYDERSNCDAGIKRLSRFRDEIGSSVCVVASGNAEEAEIVHR